MIRWLIALGLVLAQVAAVFAQAGNPLPDTDDSKRPRDFSRDRQWNQWNQPKQPETQEQARERWEREHRSRFELQPNPSYKPGSEPPRPQQQPPNLLTPDASSSGPYRSR